MLEVNIRFAGCARSFRTELNCVDIAETSRFCSMLEEILSVRSFGFVCRASVFIRINSFEDSSTFGRIKAQFIRKIYY